MTESQQKRPLHIIFFGDSICFGQGVAIHKGWVTRLSACLSKLGQDHGREALVINASVNGNTTRQALERMPYDIQSHGVDIIIIQFGLNDCNHWESDKGNPRVSAKAFEANLEEIIHRAMTFGARAVFLNTNHPTGRDKDPLPRACKTYEFYNRQYNEIIRQVSKTNDHIILNDIESAFDRAIADDKKNLASLLLPDLLHLNERGHDLYFEVVVPSLMKSVGELLRFHAEP